MSILDLNTMKGKCLDGVVREFEPEDETIAKCGMVCMLRIIMDAEAGENLKAADQEFVKELKKSADLIINYIHTDYELRIVKGIGRRYER